MKERRRDAAAMSRRFRFEIRQPVICETRPTETWQRAADGSHPARRRTSAEVFIKVRILAGEFLRKGGSFIFTSEAPVKETSAGHRSAASASLHHVGFLRLKTRRGRRCGRSCSLFWAERKNSFNFLQSHHCSKALKSFILLVTWREEAGFYSPLSSNESPLQILKSYRRSFFFFIILCLCKKKKKRKKAAGFPAEVDDVQTLSLYLSNF